MGKPTQSPRKTERHWRHPRAAGATRRDDIYWRRRRSRIDGEGPSFTHHFTTSYDPAWTFTRSNTQTFVDHEGLIRTAGDGEAAFVGARRVDNLADATNRSLLNWDQAGSVSVESATEATFSAVGAQLSERILSSGMEGNTYRFTLDISTTSGSGLFRVRMNDGVGNPGQADLTINTTVQRLSVIGTADAAATHLDIQLRTPTGGFTGSIVVGDIMVENVTGQANQNPSDYVDDYAYYDTENGNGANSISQPEDFSAWTTAQSTVTSDHATDPFGGVNGDKITADSGGGNGECNVQLNVTAADGDNIFSVYAKADTLDWLEIRNQSFTSNSSSYFDLTNGVTGTQGSSHSSTGMEDAGSGWYRCWVVFNTSDTAGSMRAGIADGDNDNSVPRDGASSILVSSACFSAGSTLGPYGEQSVVVEAAGSALTGLEGILLEGAATNECTYSRTLDTANNWQMNGTGITQTLNDAVSPFGTMTATKIDATTTTGYVQYRILVTVTANTEYTFSWYALLGTATVVDYRVYDNSNAADIIATTPYGSELNTSTYTRVEKTFTTPAGCTSIACYVAAGFESPRFDGTIWCDGVQVEEGNFATSQIDTTSTPLSRTATQLDRNWTLPANNMSYFVEFVVNHDETDLVAGGKRIIEFDDGTVDHRALSYFQNGTGLFQGQKRTNGGFASLGTHPTLGYVKGDTITVAFTANETQTAQWLNGTNKRALTSAIATVDWTSIPTQIGLGYSASAGVGAANAFISIKTVKVWNEEKTDTFLAGL